MLLAHAGPRVQITQYGINTQDHRPDKYIYFQTLFRLIQQIERCSKNSDPFVFIENSTYASDNDILAWIHAFHPDVVQHVKYATKRYELRLVDEIRRVRENDTISQAEKDTWIKNLELMQEYRIQRAVNKIFYGTMLDTIVDMIIKKELRAFVFPYSLEYYHIAQAVANHLHERSKVLKPTTIIKKGDTKTFIYVIA